MMNGEFILEGPDEIDGYKMLVRMKMNIGTKNNKELIKYLKKGYTIIDYSPQPLIYDRSKPRPTKTL